MFTRGAEDAFPLIVLSEAANHAYKQADQLALRVFLQRHAMDSAIDRLK